MTKPVQKTEVVKHLLYLAQPHIHCLCLRRVLPFLAMCLFMTSSSCIVWHSYYNDGVDAVNRGDYATALREWQRLAEQEHAAAQNGLGVMYEEGNGVPKDYVAAYMWYTLAASRGSKKASNNRDGVAEQMTSPQIAEAQRRARDWEPGKQQPALASVTTPQREEPATPPRSKLASARSAAVRSSASARSAAVRSSASARSAAVRSSASARSAAVRSSASARNAAVRSRIRNWKPSKEQTASTSKPNPQREQPSTPTPVLPPVLSIGEISLSRGVLNAAETVTLSIRIKNVGLGETQNLSVKLASTLPSLVFPASTTVPTVPKQGGERTVKIRIRGTLELPLAPLRLTSG